MKAFYLFFIFLIIISCSSHVSSENLIGNYVLNMDIEDSLKINSDGTYQYYRSNRGKILVASGLWQLNSSGNEITFKDFTFSTDNSFSGNWHSRINKRNKEVILIYSEEDKVYFKKID